MMGRNLAGLASFVESCFRCSPLPKPAEFIIQDSDSSGLLPSGTLSAIQKQVETMLLDCRYPFLLWTLLYYVSHVTDAQDSSNEDELIKVLVGFHNVREENAYVSRQQALRGGRSRSRIKHQFKNTNALAMEVTKAELAVMRTDPKFKYIEDDVLVYQANSTRVPPSPINNHATARSLEEEVNSYGLWRTQADQEIRPAESSDDCVINLCVVDSGLFVDHEDIPYSVGDGYIRGEEFGLPSGQRWYFPQNTDHGTGVTGIMVAEGGNGEGVVGVIPDGPETSKVCLMIARVFADGEDSTSLSNIIAAAEWCADKGAGRPTVINLSVAADFKTSIEENVYQQIYERSGALIVAAAGNSGSPQKSYPASHDSVISVASVDSQLRRSFWSQYNDQVELAAPGSNIHTTNADESTIDLFSGTSFACPFVSGIATKIWAAHPECTNEDIRMAMRESAFRLGDGVPNTQFGYGLVQAVDANDYLIENFDCAVAETSQPTATPSADPTPSPTPIPCQHYLESCVADSDCCDGYTCRRRSSDSDISWVCRSETTRSFEAKPKLANVDGNCRGGFAGGCINVS